MDPKAEGPGAPGVVIGLDYGERRIGVARSDPSGTFAVALCVLDARNPAPVPQIARLVREHGAGRVVLGLPLRLDGGEGPAAAAARRFGERLRRALSVPVEFADERFSTASAERVLIEGGTRRARRRELVDKVAAQVLLQHYLDCRAPDPPAGPGGA